MDTRKFPKLNHPKQQLKQPSTASLASRPKFCEGEEQSPNAYGEAMAILAGLDREFAFNNSAAVATTTTPSGGTIPDEGISYKKRFIRNYFQISLFSVKIKKGNCLFL